MITCAVIIIILITAATSKKYTMNPWWGVQCRVSLVPSVVLSSLWIFTGGSRIGFVMLVLCCLIQSVPRPCVMNKEALPLFPRVLFPGCYTECVLLTKPVMDVGLPSACVFLTKRASACTATHTHRQTRKHTHSPNIHPASSLTSCIQWSTGPRPDPDTSGRMALTEYLWFYSQQCVLVHFDGYWHNTKTQLR